MFQHKLNDDVSKKTYFDWLALSFLAGSINAGGYLACSRFVSHVTGFATLSGIYFEKMEWVEAFGTLTIPMFFLMGVIVSGYFTEKKFQHKKHSVKYSPVMGLASLMIAIVVIGGELDWFGQFGAVAKIKHDYILLACLCGACGLLLDASSPKDTGVPLDRNFLFIPLMRLEFFRVRGTHVSIPPSVISLTPFQPNAMLSHGYLADTVRSMLSFEAVCPMDMAHAGR